MKLWHLWLAASQCMQLRRRIGHPEYECPDLLLRFFDNNHIVTVSLCAHLLGCSATCGFPASRSARELVISRTKELHSMFLLSRWVRHVRYRVQGYGMKMAWCLDRFRGSYLKRRQGFGFILPASPLARAFAACHAHDYNFVYDWRISLVGLPILWH